VLLTPLIGREKETMHDINSEDLAWLDDAVGYDNVASVEAAYRRLLEFRDIVGAGDTLTAVASDAIQRFSSTEQFDTWVHTRFPIFVDDILHPQFI
jgi:hypothetical protein